MFKMLTNRDSVEYMHYEAFVRVMFVTSGIQAPDKKLAFLYIDAGNVYTLNSALSSTGYV